MSRRMFLSRLVPLIIEMGNTMSSLAGTWRRTTQLAARWYAHLICACSLGPGDGYAGRPREAARTQSSTGAKPGCPPQRMRRFLADTE
ncbi:hypothetical protein BD413DRAFT_553439 [Trametes elegans]|nr:hypothetical protein BD413DRAFT_553439 [Trametes elegans]